MSESTSVKSVDTSVSTSVSTPVSEQTPDKMSAVRNAKKRKAQEDRDVLSDLKKQVGSLAESMEKAVSSGPQVVTKQKEKDEVGVPSFSTEVLRTGAVAALGLATFYISNIWAKRPKLNPAPLMTPPPSPAPSPTSQAIAPSPAPSPPPSPSQAIAPPAPPAPKASPTTFIELPPPPKKRKVGASGLLE